MVFNPIKTTLRIPPRTRCSMGTPVKLALAKSYSSVNILEFHPQQVMALFRVPVVYIRQAVAFEITRIHDGWKPITKSYIAANNPKLLEWSKIVFRNWHSAVEAAGFDYATMQKEAKASQAALQPSQEPPKKDTLLT